ncbi:MAG: imidazole glycerol phosphate synthase subunit HisH [bacterium]
MTKRVALIDYGRGNLRSVQKALEQVGLNVAITRRPAEILDACAVVLPGVGAFKDCMDSLERLGLTEPLVRSIRDGKPYLGICLGLQILFEESEEFGRAPGLGLFPGKVRRFPSDAPSMSDLKVPHMGWNRVRLARSSELFDGIPPEAHFYFVHSFYADPSDGDLILAKTKYGVPFASVIQKERMVATQFHPEKSQRSGLRFLRNFGDLL